MDNTNQFKYVMVKTADSPSSDEVEVNKVETELSILWGDLLLYSNVINKTFTIGEENCDFTLPVDKIVIANGCLQSIQLTKEYSKMTVKDFTIQARLVQAGKVHPISLFDNLYHSVYIGLSGAAHFALLLSIAFFMPPLGIADAGELNKDNLYLIQQYLHASAEREQEAKEKESITADDQNNKQEGGTGQRAIGEEGSMGNSNARASNSRFGIAGPKDNKDVHIAREAAIREATNFGMIGLLNSGAGGDPNAPTAPWGQNDSLGNDPLSARGNMWGADIGESNGIGGLGLSGIGIGGGGTGEGIGLTNNGDFIGHSFNKNGIGNGFDRAKGTHKVKDIKVRIGTTVVNGRLPAEIIQRIMRQQYGAYRNCFNFGLRNNPSLSGRVAMRFVIGRDGSVSNVNDGGSDLPDAGVISCMLRATYGISFPAPENGIVTVVYPIFLNQQ